MNKKIRINFTYDEYECDDCGACYADGADVFLDGEPFLEFTPVAHCYGGVNWEKSDIYRAILIKLGFELEEDEGY